MVSEEPVSPQVLPSVAADRHQTPVGQQSTLQVQLASNQAKVGAPTTIGKRAAASPAAGPTQSHSQAAATNRNESNAKSGKKSVQFATNESRRRFIDTIDAKRRRQDAIEQNDAVHRQTISPAGVSNPVAQEQSQDTASLRLGPPQPGSVLYSKSNAKRSKSRPNFVEGF